MSSSASAGNLLLPTTPNGTASSSSPDVRAAAAPPKPRADGGKMQQLLALARERLREQQNELAAREATIAELREALEASSKAPSAAQTTTDVSEAPRRALCHVSEKSLGLSEKGRWLLLEFEEALEWRRFESEARLHDFVRRDPGSEPLEVPEPAMTIDDARDVREKAEQEVAKIADDFRKYRVQAEIQRKQREALHREETARREVLATADKPPETNNNNNSKSASAREAEDRKKLQSRVEELEAENEKLSTDAALAAQWKSRYDAAVDDRDRLQAQVRKLRSAGADSSEYAALARDHDELKREFKNYRAQALKALRAQELTNAGSTASSSGGGPRALDALGDRGASQARRRERTTRTADDSVAKLQYLKNLMLNYLGSSEAKAKEHMERAIVTVLAFSPDEKARIDQAKKATPASTSTFF
ncbi:hypothetical protein CTAYLR_005466 [Chrysophaeum taylorii]|uniref:GRIP domain-containing protein n=1 Tax=Chrysophaeum taylorii TaxID=2483200 RepID=A0AAD7UJN1_9STRA|nr:hypothetical protein CTAYLR_005466 [Chrysophaeum taylorii]